jgi:branched-subunit amino acid ABC-type transport system permease component
VARDPVSSYLPFIVAGIATGSVYAIAATGLVLTYKTSGIFNFAHGAVAAAAAYAFAELTGRGVPWPVAAVLCCGVFGPAVGLLIELLVRSVAGASTAAKLVLTVGLLLAIEGAAVLIYGPATRDFPPFLPTRTVRLLGTYVGFDQLITMALGIVIVGVLFAFFRFTRLGLAMNAVVESPDLLGLYGTSPTRVRRVAWMIGCGFASVSGLLLAPSLGLEPLLLTLLVVQAFGAAAIGGFSSIPMTYVGGIAVGVATAICGRFVGEYPALTGLDAAVPFLILFLVLLLSPRGRLAVADVRSLSRQAATRAAPAMSRAGLVAAFAVAVVIPHVVGTHLPVYTTAVAYVIVFASLGLLVRTAGQVSLCQVGFAAVGAAASAHLSEAGVPWLLAVAAGGLVAVPIGAMVAIPAIRLAGLYLAIATFGFGILLEKLVYARDFMFGANGSVTARRPDIAFIHAGSDTSYYYVVLAIVVVCVAALVTLERSRLGRLLKAMADAPVALSTLGANLNLIRVLVFCASAFFAGVGGALLGPVTGSINGVTFASFDSLILLAVLVIMGSGPLRPAILASVGFIVIPSYVDNVTVNQALPLVFGVGAMAAMILTARGEQLRGWLAARAHAWSWRSRHSPVNERLINLSGLVPDASHRPARVDAPTR